MCHCSKPEGIGRDTPDKQGDNCLQPASENYQQFLFSLKATFGGFVWKFRLKFCLQIYFRNFVWKFCLDVCLDISFGNFVWKTDRPTDRATLEAPSRSLKITHTHTPSMESNSPLERSSLKIDTFHLLFWPISPHIPNFRHIFTLFLNSKV